MKRTATILRTMKPVEIPRHLLVEVHLWRIDWERKKKKNYNVDVEKSKTNYEVKEDGERRKNNYEVKKEDEEKRKKMKKREKRTSTTPSCSGNRRLHKSGSL